MFNLLFTALPVLVVALAVPLLILLTIIDLRHYLLPDRYVFPLAALGLLFHASLGFTLVGPEHALLGAVIGGGLLYIVRGLGTWYYKQEAMGLGDVKLLAAGGMWLGPAPVITAILVGAMAGLAHGVLVAISQKIKSGGPFSIRRLVIPAGPGFIAGLVLVFAYEFGPDLVRHTIGIID